MDFLNSEGRPYHIAPVMHVDFYHQQFESKTCALEIYVRHQQQQIERWSRQKLIWQVQ